MKLSIVGALMCLVVMTMGCSGGVTVDQDFEPDTDFFLYKTWDWNPNSETDELVAASQTQSVKDYDQYFKSVVADQMTEKGYTLVQTNPDILITYKVGMRNAEGAIDWDLDYQDQMKNADVYKTHGGIVVFDIHDARTGRKVWHGTGTGSVNIDPTPDMAKEEVRKAVIAVLNQYPPK